MSVHLLFRVSINDCSFILTALRLLLGLSFTSSSDLEAPQIQASIPTGVESVLDFMSIEPQTTAYVCCPQCFQIYSFNPDDDSSYPDRCSHKDTRSSKPCNRLLRRAQRSKGPAPKPVRLFLYHDIREWLGQLYCRPEMEPILDHDILEQLNDDNAFWDILDAPELREFRGPEGDPNCPFLKRPGNEGHLIFSLNMDGFNPYMNKQAGKKVLTGAIYLVCLNLPLAILYNIENMYLVGIIPGPEEPSKHQINHVLRPLVDDLLQLWHDSIYLTSTPLHPRGRLIRGAVVPLVCDLPAARQMSGFAPHSSHNFCSYCLLQLDDIENFDHTTWTSCSFAAHKSCAEQWRNAETEMERAELYERTGVRWSELLRLPYWDPTKFVVIDSMHSFFLRLLQRHCRDIWGMNVEYSDGDGASFHYDKNLPTDEEISNGHVVLRTGTNSQLSKLSTPVLRQLCRDTQTIHFGGGKKKLIRRLFQYVSILI